MVEITKEEKIALLKELPSAHVVRTSKQRSKRHHYFCEETSKAMKILNDIRSSVPTIGEKPVGDLASER